MGKLNFITLYKNVYLATSKGVKNPLPFYSWISASNSIGDYLLLYNSIEQAWKVQECSSKKLIASFWDADTAISYLNMLRMDNDTTITGTGYEH